MFASGLAPLNLFLEEVVADVVADLPPGFAHLHLPNGLEFPFMVEFESWMTSGWTNSVGTPISWDGDGSVNLDWHTELFHQKMELRSSYHKLLEAAQGLPGPTVALPPGEKKWVTILRSRMFDFCAAAWGEDPGLDSFWRFPLELLDHFDFMKVGCGILGPRWLNSVKNPAYRWIYWTLENMKNPLGLEEMVVAQLLQLIKGFLVLQHEVSPVFAKMIHDNRFGISRRFVLQNPPKFHAEFRAAAQTRQGWVVLMF